MDPRISARPEDVIEVRGRPGEAPQLLEIEGQELGEGGAAGEGLADGVDQRQVLRSGEDVVSGVRALVDESLEVEASCGTRWISSNTAPSG